MAYKKTNYLPHVDGLRAVAVIGVLLFHLDIPFVTGGYVGVDVFFVISGFLITRLLIDEFERTGTIRFRNFYWRRIRRLVPALLAVLITSGIVGALILSPAPFARFAQSVLTTIFSVSNILFWSQSGYFDSAAQSKPLLHTWSLSVEEQFYLFWPLILFLFLKFHRRWLTILAVVILAYISVRLNREFADGRVELIAGYSSWLDSKIQDSYSTLFYWLPFRVYELMIGALTAFVMKTEKLQLLPFKNWLYDFLFVAGLLMILSSFYFFNDKMLFPEYPGFLPCVGSAFIIYSGDRAKSAIMLRWKPIVGIGLISYSLYLIHWPLIVFWIEIQSIGTGFRFPLIESAKIIIFILSILLAYVSYRFVEQPFRKSTAFLTIRSKIIFALIPIILVALSVNVINSNGWKWRASHQLVADDDILNVIEGDPKIQWDIGTINFEAVYTGIPADIILIGDSHAEHYGSGFYLGWTHYARLSLHNSSKPGCFQLPGVSAMDTFWSKNLEVQCPIIFAQSVEKIKSSHQPLVILSQSWLGQLGSSFLIDENGKRIERAITVNDIFLKIRLLKEMIKPSLLIVIGESHHVNVNLYDLITRPNFARWIVKAPKGLIKTTPLDESFREFNNKLAQAAKEDGYLFLDPMSVLCDDKVCHNFDQDGHLLFADSNHFNYYGSRYVIRAFLPELKKLRPTNH
ncbi:MAG: acyltransferase [Leptonema sp. (in: Bacteria)]|nr:acyltransferase [Leptonema sp. (in: bacteria)]